MIATLAFRHLLVRKLRSLLLLFGFALGVGVMIVLLSVGEAMLAQSRDVSLVGGGEITVLPQGIDVEAMRTGGLSGMFFGIDRARFLTRQVLGGERQRSLVRVVSPAIEGKLLYLQRQGRTVAVRAGGDIPSRAAAVGSSLPVREGRWSDSPADSAYVAPTAQQLYDELDHFHLPPQSDSAWGEWHYFNFVTGPKQWWYVTFLIGGSVELSPSDTGDWGGQLLVTHRKEDGSYERFQSRLPAQAIAFDTARADLSLGPSYVRQRSGRYQLHLTAGRSPRQVQLDVSLIPSANQFFPPVELGDKAIISGYVVPALAATASGRICVAQRCRSFSEVPAYHDHNWGVWRDVTWEWGAARGSRLNFLYGGIYGPQPGGTRGPGKSSPFFLTLLDSLGVRQVLRFDEVRYEGRQKVSGDVRATAPARFNLLAVWEQDSLRLDVIVADALATEMRTGSYDRVFLQMRGHFRLRGRVEGKPVSDSGSGFFETYVHAR